MAIGIISFRNAVLDRAVAGTSGYDATLIEKCNQAQNQLFNTLMPRYELNQAIKDALAKFVEETTKNTTITTGLLGKEANYVHFLAVMGVGVSQREAFPINVNEVAIIKNSKIRTPNEAKGLIFYYQKENDVYFLPTTVMSVTYAYMRRPLPVALTLTPTTSTDIDYLVPSAPTDFEWPEEMFDLLLYMTLEKLGMEMKENILVEYAKIGISSEMINVEPQ